MRQYLLAIPFILLFVVFHILGTQIGGEFSNVSPLVALFFCGAVYMGRSKILLPVAFVAWLVVMPITSAMQGFSPWTLGNLVAVLAFAAIAGFGFLFKKQKPVAVLSGAFGSAVFFHLFTNTIAFFSSPIYQKNWAGLAQALWTIPTGSTIPTAIFFRNTCVSTLLFTTLFLLAAHHPVFRRQPSVVIENQPSHG